MCRVEEGEVASMTVSLARLLPFVAADQAMVCHHRCGLATKVLTPLLPHRCTLEAATLLSLRSLDVMKALADTLSCDCGRGLHFGCLAQAHTLRQPLRGCCHAAGPWVAEAWTWRPSAMAGYASLSCCILPIDSHAVLDAHWHICRRQHGLHSHYENEGKHSGVACPCSCRAHQRRL